MGGSDGRILLPLTNTCVVVFCRVVILYLALSVVAVVRSSVKVTAKVKRIRRKTVRPVAGKDPDFGI